ncbi:MAG TPA: serine/threonine-protein kinase [Bryobacteraceae bacterium]|nr:serine/threonine-protein kinase [Bryobacteraceae bacterium]
MKPLTDQALHRLREAASLPDLSGTRYHLLRELGRGGMGVVYLAEDSELRREVAVKVLHLDAPRMRAEAQTLAQLEHPNIVPIYDFGTLPDNRLFYVMKFVQGTRLDFYLRQPHALADRLRLFERICEAVAFAHSRGVIHRDLKPQNIMVGAFGEVLIMDWGLAKFLSEQEPADRIMGTPDFMVPEQTVAEGHVDERADIYALGRILALLGGPQAVQSIWEKAQAIDPHDRYETVQALSNDILRFLDGRPVSAHHETVFEMAGRFYTHNRTLLLLVLAYLMMRFLIFFWTRH